MALTFTNFVGTPAYVECNGGGLVMYARTTCELTAEAESDLAAFKTAIGAGTGKVIGATFVKSSADMEVDGGGDGVQPYIDYANQKLEWRNAKTGAVGATPILQAALVLDVVVVV